MCCDSFKEAIRLRHLSDNSLDTHVHEMKVCSNITYISIIKLRDRVVDDRIQTNTREVSIFEREGAYMLYLDIQAGHTGS